MTDETEKPEAEGGEAILAGAFAQPAKRVKGKRKLKEPPKPEPGEPASPVRRPRAPTELPPEAPVTALGTREGEYHFLDSLGQLRHLRADQIGRLHILSLFGGDAYLKAVWPIFEQDKTTKEWIARDKFDHDKMAPVLVLSCTNKGVWDPTHKVRGCGTWVEESGDLVMHCGDKIFRTIGDSVVGEKAGVLGDLLYPRRPPLPEPEFRGTDEAGPMIMEQLDTWHWKRPDVDPKCALGWLVSSFLGQAQPWRPAIWTRGPKSSGKSTLVRFFEWLHTKAALIMPSNTTQAYIYQMIGDSSLPVALDEFEAKEDNRRVQDVIDLMRIAASGGELGRGGGENNPKTYVLKSCFCAFSILMPPLSPQDVSRLAILELLPLRRKTSEELKELELVAPAEYDLVLGNRGKWAKAGRQLRGRVLQQWPRYLKTYQAYFRAMLRAGHDDRAASQFGALGAGYDIAMFDKLDLANATRWAEALPAADLAETKGYVNEPEACLQYLLSAKAEPWSQGAQETVRYHLERSRKDLEDNVRSNDPNDASRVLARLGIRIYRHKELVSIGADGDNKPLWLIMIANTHSALGKIFENTQWKGKPGVPGTWAQALRGLECALDKPKQMRIDNWKGWTTRLIWDGVFPPFNEKDDAEEIAEVMAADRLKTEDEKRGARSI